jgi:hypothetical protein
MLSPIDSATYTPLAYNATSSSATTASAMQASPESSITPQPQLGPATAVSTDTLLHSTFSTITTMLQNLMSMLQTLLKGLSTGGIAGASDNNSDSGSYNSGVTREPATIIPVNPADQSTTTVTASSDSKTSATDQSQGSSRTGSTKKTTKTKKTSGKKKTTSKKGSTLQGKGEFLWKPKSDKDGKLAILLPKYYSGSVESVRIIAPDDSRALATGKPAGIGNGDREHFRFNKAGGEFPDGSVVLITLKDGSELKVPIKDTATRYTK